MATAQNPTLDSPGTGVGSRRGLMWLSGLGVLIIIGVIFALFALRQGSKSYPAGSPEHAVATYVGDLQQGKVDAAYAMTDFPPTNEFGDPRANFHQQWDGWSARSHRVSVVSTRRFGIGASVTVDVEAFSANPMGPSDSTTRVTFTLRHDSNGWRITGPEYAYVP